MNRPNRYISRDALSLSSVVSFEELKEFYKDKDWMCDRITTLETHLRVLKSLAPYAAINFIRKGMGYEEYLREYAEYRKIKPEELSEILDRLTESTKGMNSLEEWESYIEEYTEKLEEQARKAEQEREGVLISTLHGVKGLEYEQVYILNVNEGSMPYRKAVLEPAIEEERRLFYVGMTRARKQLALCYVRQQYEKKRGTVPILKGGWSMKAVIYFTEVPQQYEHKNMEHMIGEKLLATGLYKEYGLKLAFEPRATGEHGKPFLTLQPRIHYNITHSGKYVMCIIADQEIGIDVQVHKKVNYERMLERMVPADMIREILDSDEPEKAFFTQWVLREAYIKWTGEGLSRDLRTISMDDGTYLMLELGEDYSGAVWSRKPLELRWEHAEVQLP